MNNQRLIQVYDAIRQMERISEAGGEFSFSFVKYNRQNGKGGDIARISRARLRKKTPNDVIEHSDYKLFFTDLDANLPRNCWQILILEFNGQKCFI
ncbi:MAG TPA: hypothetical protein VK152_06635 [Paludibacter sp.]|nr:hypothetical protein [Paludibacter sp.]